MFNDIGGLLNMLVTFVSFVAALRFLPAPRKKAPLKDPITYAILVINLIFTGLLPLQLIAEFPPSSGGRYADYIFIFCHYPHITIYPILFFGLVVIFVFRALFLWREHASVDLRWLVGIAFAVALLVTYWEVSGRQMMLFEFNTQAQGALELFSPERISGKAKAVGLPDAFDSASTMGQQVMAGVNNGLTPPEAATKRMDQLLNHYEAWNNLGAPWTSMSRTLYMTLFFYMIFIVLIGYAISVYLPRTGEPKDLQDARDFSISVNLLCAFLVILLWMPFRVFYNVNTKIPLFGPDNIIDNFFGKIPLSTICGFTSADILPLIFTLSFTVILLIRIRRLSRKHTVMLMAIGGVLFVVGVGVLARVNRKAFLEIIGADQELKHIAFRIFFAFVATLFIYRFVESIPAKNGRNGEKKSG